MPDVGVDISQFERLPFDEAIALFREKIALPTESWDELWNEYQNYAFTVSGITRGEVLQDIQDAIARAMEEGTAIGQFKKDFNQIIERRGWSEGQGFSAYRTELILSQNLRTAYAAGRWKQINDPVVAKNRPHLMWRHRDSRNPRPAHLALDGKVFSLSDPIWKVIFPPSGFSCRCQAYSLSDRDLTEMNLKPSDPPSERVILKDRVTGKTQQVPAVRVDGKLTPIAEPGFAFAPGDKRLGDGWMESAIARLSPALQKQVREDIAA